MTLVGTEISTTVGHIVALDLPDPVFRFSGDGQDALDDVRDFGASAFAAHPYSPRADFVFSGWKLPGPWGLELINGDSQWREAGWGRLGLTALLYGLNSRYALVRSLSAPDATLREWDRMLQGRDVPGIVGADAHDRVPISKRVAPRFPSYESVFGLAQNHVLLDRPLSLDAKSDARSIVSALAHGRSYVGVDGLAPAAEFSFTAEADGRRVTMGETLPAASAVRFLVSGQMPAGTRLALLKDGRVIQQATDRLEANGRGAGVYRIEAFVRGTSQPWILTNPIYLFDAEAAAQRAARAGWPEAAPAPQPIAKLDDFEGPTSFAAEFDPSSKMQEPIVVAGVGVERSHAARLAFRLGAPTPGRPDTWCALVSRQARDLSRGKGLVLSLRADGVYRLWLQVRDANPASAEGGEEWWFASLKTGPEWRRVTIPFERFRSINPKTDGRLDLDQVRGLVFVLDRGSVQPGASGEILIDDLALF